MLTHRSRRAAAVLAAGAWLVAGANAPARAAAGSIKFKELKVGLSSAHHRPMPPIIVVQRIGGVWTPSGLPVQFELSIRAKVNTFSSIFRLLVGVPTLAENSVDAWTPGFGEGRTKVDIGASTFDVPADQLNLSPMTAGDVCAQAPRGQGNDFLVPIRLPLEVQVSAARGITNVEREAKTFTREIDAAVRCIVLSETEAAHPQRMPVAPQRTAVKPQRTPVKPQRTAVEPQRLVTPIPAILALPKPDLVVRRARAVAGDASRLEAEVANVGSADAGACRLKLVYRRSGHVLEREEAVPALGAGDSAWVRIEAPGAFGPGIGVVLSVDDEDAVEERDEENNSHVFN